MYVLVVAPQPLGQLINRLRPRLAQALEELPSRRGQRAQEQWQVRQRKDVERITAFGTAVPRRLEAVERVARVADPQLEELRQGGRRPLRCRAQSRSAAARSSGKCKAPSARARVGGRSRKPPHLHS